MNIIPNILIHKKIIWHGLHVIKSMHEYPYCISYQISVAVFVTDFVIQCYRFSVLHVRACCIHYFSKFTHFFAQVIMMF